MAQRLVCKIVQDHSCGCDDHSKHSKPTSSQSLPVAHENHTEDHHHAAEGQQVVLLLVLLLFHSVLLCLRCIRTDAVCNHKFIAIKELRCCIALTSSYY